MKNLTLKDLKEIKIIKSNLRKIKEHGTAPINLVRYRKMGLIKPHTTRLGKGSTYGVKNRIVSKIRLTEKGRRILTLRL